MLSAKFGFRRRMAGTLLAVTLAPWGTPALAQTAPAHAEAASAASALQAQLPSGVTLRYGDALAALYAAHREQPMWQDSEAVRDFQQQLAELALSGVQPQFAHWADALTDPRIHGMARDILLSDAMMGYLQYVAGGAAGVEYSASASAARLGAYRDHGQHPQLFHDLLPRW